MATMTAYATEVGVGTIGPRLPLIASKAAIEFDRAIQGRPMGFTSAKLLAGYLKKTLGHRAAEGTVATSFDAATVGIVGRALTPVPSQETTICDVVNKAWELAEQMEASSPDSDVPSLEQAKRFCVEFGNNLIFYRESLNQFRPANPYKR